MGIPQAHALLQGIFPNQGQNFLSSTLAGRFFTTREYLESESEVTQSYPILCDPRTAAYQAPPSMGFSRQEYWYGLPFPSPEDLPNPGTEPGSPAL